MMNDCELDRIAVNSLAHTKTLNPKKCSFLAPKYSICYYRDVLIKQSWELFLFISTRAGQIEPP